MQQNEYSFLKTLVNDNLERFLPDEVNKSKTVLDSMKYSLNGGGKRLRPVLLLASCKMVGGELESALPFACAIEYIHTYSLIHDDLPAMDDDDLRRGRATNHKVYGEACAILAGDALLNRAYEVMTDCICNAQLDRMKDFAKAASCISNASGYYGIIGGQIADIEGENSSINDLELLRFIHKHKTAALIRGAICAGAYVGGASQSVIEDLSEFGEMLGLAFQIYDDILDVCGDTQILGKPVGSDDKNGKLTYVSCVGLEKARKLFEETHMTALKKIEAYGKEADLLRSIAEELHDRIK